MHCEVKTETIIIEGDNRKLTSPFPHPMSTPDQSVPNMRVIDAAMMRCDDAGMMMRNMVRETNSLPLKRREEWTGGQGQNQRHTNDAIVKRI